MFEYPIASPENAQKVELIQFFEQEMLNLESTLTLKENETLARRATVLEGTGNNASQQELLQAERELRTLKERQTILQETIRRIQEGMQMPVGAFEILKQRETQAASLLRSTFDSLEANPKKTELKPIIAERQADLAKIVELTELLKKL